MFRKVPPLHALAAFDAAARHGSFAKAAEELCLTDSAVSHRIRQLEQHLDTQLFVRLSKHVILTPKGEAFLGVVRETLTRLDDASSRLRENARPLLRISVLPAFAAGWLMPRIARFGELYPGIDLEIQTSNELVNLKAGEADIAVRYGVGQWPDLRAEQLFTDCMFPVASPEYLAKFRRVDEPCHLEGAVLLRHRRLPWKAWFEAARLGWEEPQSGPIFTDVGIMHEAAAGGHGIALARSSLAAAYLRQGRLVRLTGVVTPSDRNFHVVFMPEAEARSDVRAFSRWIIETARSERPDPCASAAAREEALRNCSSPPAQPPAPVPGRRDRKHLPDPEHSHGGPSPA
jgi:LysR family glycine cleavage system transcriptional activator